MPPDRGVVVGDALVAAVPLTSTFAYTEYGLANPDSRYRGSTASKCDWPDREVVTHTSLVAL
ncbi:MAG: hypothetical protein ACAI43_15970 [Phycisphaerae bacterium]|nr:hypothetical protein [Tepidisphaeraceae bacterium]